MAADSSPNPVDVVAVDIGNVVCRFEPDARLVALHRLSGLPTDTIDGLVFESGFDHAADRGAFELAAYRATLCSLLHLPDDAPTHRALDAAWAEAFIPDERVLALLDRVTVPLVAFSNNGPMLEAVLSTTRAEVGARFTKLALTHRLGAMKPEPEAYERAEAILGTAGDRVLFVDDSQANVDAGNAHGWRSHRIVTHLDLNAALAGAGVLGPRHRPPGDSP